MINSHAHLDFDSMNTIAQNAIAIVPSIGNQNWTDVQMYPYFSFGIPVNRIIIGGLSL